MLHDEVSVVKRSIYLQQLDWRHFQDLELKVRHEVSHSNFS
jgi:hypothetical protein